MKFRCKRSGNFVSFEDEGDIKSMRVHEEYEEVIENGKNETSNEESSGSNSSEGEDGNDDGENGKEDGKEREEKGNVLIPSNKRGRPAKNK